MMRRKSWSSWIAVACLIVSFVLLNQLAAAGVPPGPPSPATSQRVTATMMDMPLQFEANHGQVDAHVKFMARGKGYTLFLTPTESVMVLQQREAPAAKDPLAMTDPTVLPEPAPIKQAVVRMKLVGANEAPEVDGMEQLPGIVNYFIGNDPKKWRTKIPTYAKVQYQEAYPGIDLAYYGNQGKLEYDFIVAPGADPDQIKLAFEGASDVKIADSGDLLLATALGEVRLQQPVIYQLEASGHKTLVAGHYVLGRPAISQHTSQSTQYEVGFTLASYDQTKPIIIDPVLLYSTYLGGNTDDVGNGIAVDGTGHVYVTGQTNSTTFPQVGPLPASGPGISAFVTKFSATGSSLLYSTFLGGANNDFGKSIAVDGFGQAYVTGITLSSNFPIVAPVQATTGGGGQDAFVTKLSATGSSLLYSTYLGGTSFDYGQGIAVDGAGQAYVTGYTNSPDFPRANAFQALMGSLQDAFVTKLNAAGGFVYSTYLGGNGPDEGLGIAVDGAGQAYVTGTASGTFPTVNAAQATTGGGGDAFVTKFNATGSSLLYSTFLGGSGGDTGLGIAVDGAEQAYVTGWTFGNFPTVNAVQATFGGVRDAFVTKLNAAGNSLVYSTYLGGSHYDEGNGIGVDGAGQAYVTGSTASTNFPTATPIQATNGGGGNWDVFVTKLNAGGTSFLYSTYLGGTLEDRGNGIAVDGAGRAYVTGSTQSPNFPTANAFQATKSSFSGRNAFVTKLVDKPTANAGPDQSVPEGTPVMLDGTGSTGVSLTYSWNRIAGPMVTLGDATSGHPTFSAPGVPPAGDTVTFELVVCEGTSSNCSDPDSVNVHITDVNHPPVADAGPDQTLQEGSSVQLNGTGSYDPDVETITYLWTQLLGPAVALTGPNTHSPTFTAPTVGSAGETLVFDLTVTDPHNLTGPDSVSIHVSNVNQSPVAHAGPDQTVNENTLVTLDGTGSFDPDLDTRYFTWTQTFGPSVSLTGGTMANPTFTTPLVGAGGAILTFQLVVSDGQASSVADTVDIHVQDLNAPLACELAQPSVAILWPPHHTMVPVSITGVTDPNNQAVTFAYPTVTQDEPTSGLGGGDTSPDAAVSGNQILLRAERDKSIDGRVYVVHFTAADGQGGSCNGIVKVSVPYHGKKGSAVEGPQLYNSFAP